jgi:hypothetical protein
MKGMLGMAIRKMAAVSVVGGLALLAIPSVASASTSPTGHNDTFRVNYDLWHRAGVSTVTLTDEVTLRSGDIAGAFDTYNQSLSFLGSHAGTFYDSVANDTTVFKFVSGWDMIFTNSTGTGYVTTPKGFKDGTLQIEP